MRKRRFAEEQITLALRQVEVGTPITSIRRKLEISGTTFFRTTFFRWKKHYGSLGGRSPANVRADGYFISGPNQLQNSRV